jgi:alkaline phosphatase D
MLLRRILYFIVCLGLAVFAKNEHVLAAPLRDAHSPSRTVAAASVIPETESPYLTHGPVVGAVTDSSARIFARTNDSAQVQVRYGTLPDLSDAIFSAPQFTKASHDFTTIIPLTKLQAATVYYVDIWVNGLDQIAPPYPRFKTFPTAGSNVPFKFVFLTDLHSPTADLGTFNAASLENPDFVIIGGDFGFGNQNTLFEKRAAYKQLYNASDTHTWTGSFVAKILDRFPVAHMWDDHDFGANNTDKFYPYKAQSYQALTEYFPVYPLSPYGDWQKFSYAQADFFLLDSRSQRDPNGTPDGPNKSMLDGNHLGAQGQWQWLEQGLLHSTAKWKFIVTPVVFNKTFRKPDSWYGFRYERAQLVQFIRAHSISGVILLSGDAHMGGLDDGSHSDFPELLAPGPNLPSCSSAKKSGKWSNGTYWTGAHQGLPCNGYGVVTVQTDLPQVQLQVKDTQGTTKLDLTVRQ